MRGKTSFQRRLIRSFSGFSAAFLLILVSSMWMVYQAGKESVVQRLFATEIESLIARRATDPSAPLPDSWVKGYAQRDDIPEPWRSNLHRFEPDDEIPWPLREWREVQLWTGSLPGSAGDVYLFADHRTTPRQWLQYQSLWSQILLASLITLGFGYWLSRFVSARLARPLKNLQQEVDAYAPGQSRPIAADDYPDEEIARLASSFRQLHERMDAFVAREQEFTRHASHELRTPITIIRTAGSVLQQRVGRDEDPRARRAVLNLIRAADDMTRLVNTFLWMAREDGAVERDELFDVAALVTSLCEHHRVLLRPQNTLETRIEPQVWHSFPGNLFGIAAANIIRNACQHAGPGVIEVTLRPDRLEVMNPLADKTYSPHEPPDQPGPGNTRLGLRIVERISARCGWTWTSAPDAGRDAWRASIIVS